MNNSRIYSEYNDTRPPFAIRRFPKHGSLAVALSFLRDSVQAASAHSGKEEVVHLVVTAEDLQKLLDEITQKDRKGLSNPVNGHIDFSEKSAL